MPERQNVFTRVALEVAEELGTMRKEAAKGFHAPDIGEEVVSKEGLRQRFRESREFRERYLTEHGQQAALDLMRKAK